jgi:hypothetical protein
MHNILCIVGTMKHQTLYGSLLAVGIVAVVICVGMVTGFSGMKPFISVDPLSDKNVGDQFTITGTTSLPAGTQILAEVYPASYEDKTGTGSGEFTGATGTVTITKGTDGANTWAFPLDTTTFMPMEYLVSVSSVKGDLSKGDYTKGDISGSTKFTVHPASGTAIAAGSTRLSDNAAPGGILIDAIRDTPAGDPLVVSGRTNLTVGTDLLVKVLPVLMNNGRITGDSAHPEITTMTKVVAGSGSANRFSVPLDSRILPLADHIVTVSTVKGGTGGTNAEPGTITGSYLFNIIAEVSGTGQSGSATGQYITIDPVADKTTGDFLIVTGSTNLPAGTTLTVVAGSTGGNTLVNAGTGRINRYSMAFDTSIMKPGTKTITVNERIGDLAKGDSRPGIVNATGSFTLKGSFLATDTLVQVTGTTGDYIRMDAIGDKKVGDQFLITGTTSLPVGTEVIWQVLPDTGTPPTRVDGDSQMAIGGNSVVTKGDGTTNRISLAADMANMVPQKYAVIVGKPKRDQSQGPPFSFEIGDLYGTISFTLK